MADNLGEKKQERSITKLILFTLLCLTVAGGIVGWMLFGHIILWFMWQDELDKALALAQNDNVKGRAQIESILSRAEQEKLEPDIMMSMYRKYAGYLYSEDAVDDGDQQIEKAITIGKAEPVTNCEVAEQLTHAYQDRGRKRHERWMKDRNSDTGEHDQTMSVESAETSFGPDHEQTVTKIAKLAVICADTGQFDKADKWINSAVTAVKTKASAQQSQSYVYGQLAHVKAIEHKYTEAYDAHLKAQDTSSNREESNRAWNDFKSGLRCGQQQSDTVVQEKLAKSLLNNCNYAELDRLSEQYATDKTSYWDGMWKLDWFTTAFQGYSKMSKKRYDQRVFELNKWLAINPKSAAARVALAQLYLYRAWQIKDNEEDKTGVEFKKLVAKAKKTLAADATLSHRYPKASIPLMRLAAAEDNKPQLLNVIDDANKRWPTYFCADSWALQFLSNDWFGESGDKEDYITKRANTIGGVQGDKFYARAIWYEYDNSRMRRPFEGEFALEWDRVKRGFQQILKEFPDEVEARIAYMVLAKSAKENDTARKAFDGFKPKKSG